jgi:hypothetical protein
MSNSILTVNPCPHCGQTVFTVNNPYPRAKPKEIRWVHKRGMRGDVETHAASKEQAIATFRHFGYTSADDSNVSPGRSKVPVIPASDDFERAK